MIRIGKIVATHGLQGSLILSHIAGTAKWLKKDDALFLEINKGSYIPFFVMQAKANGNDEFVLQLDEVDTMESAKKLIGKQVYVQEDVLSKYAQDSPLLWIGFKMIDKQKGSIGEVNDIMQTASQWLAQVMHKDKEVLVPLIEQTIEQVNLKTRTIHVKLPDGLLEVYLGAEEK